MEQRVLIKERFKAMGYHFIFSMLLGLIALYLVFFLWYPHPLDIAMGVTKIYLIMLVIDLFIGPIFTGLILKKDRKKFILDLCVILILQLSAYGYGLYTMSVGRAAWLVFVVDDLEIVAPIDVQSNSQNHIHKRLLSHPEWIAATYSTNAEVAKRQKEDEIFKGISLATRPEAFHPIVVKSNEIIKRLKPLKDLNKFNAQEVIAKELLDYKTASGWLPVKASELDMVALFNSKGEPLGIINLRPWN